MATSFNAITRYYQACWDSKLPVTELVAQFFNRDAYLTYHALDDPLINFDCRGREEICDQFFKPWANITNRSGTIVCEFSCEQIQQSVYKVCYYIIQQHHETKYALLIHDVIRLGEDLSIVGYHGQRRWRKNVSKKDT
uniref:Uncharacterized protein n=1 Tax=viral metagenome TaxID=1070528 RepID=A0A6C0BRG1_9ZZZZ